MRQPLVAGDERHRLQFGTGVQLTDDLGAEQSIQASLIAGGRRVHE